MDNPFQEYQELLELVLMWVGFGTCVGLAAKAIVPGKDPGGAIATVLVGIVGVILGCGAVSFIWKTEVKPLTFLGMAFGIGGSAVIYIFYKLFNGGIIDEAGSDYAPIRRRRRSPSYSRSRRRNRRRNRRSRYDYAYDE